MHPALSSGRAPARTLCESVGLKLRFDCHDRTQHPSADGRALKAAYYALMRQYHPDQAAASSGGGHGLPADDATAFAALLNEIYTTLSDPAGRATYDAIAG